ncbi:decapping and exoribonuclease protein-like [Ruditapes philippinarum]|uniref:decapping and exoribonuclease protein-like n=1 Tax=Ruditapes philippinarum TaxID=129788 RepID=UPI00295B3DF2|nr:decapping and exoribonuclease protein-like [Ruditapes philippinarum]
MELTIKELDCDSVPFKDPKEIGSFSIDINSVYENSRKSLRYFVSPPNPENVRFDLRQGFDTRIIRDTGNDFHVLRWIIDNQDKFPINQDEGNGRQCTGESGQARSMEATTQQGRKHVDDKGISGKELGDLETELSGLMINKHETTTDICERAKPRKLGVDFVCRRGLLTKVMLSPYGDKEGWFIAVVYYNGTYYLNEIFPKERFKFENDEMSCWGWKFEQYLTADTKDGQPNTDVPYTNCEKLYTVVKTELNKHSLVYSGEIDALNVDDVNGDYYMEFKTNKEFSHPGNIKTFKRFKTKKWWAQSHLIGIKTIVCGFRDESGVVKRLDFYDTNSLPDLAKKDVYNPWKPNVCTNFLDKFLTFIKDSIRIDDPKIVHTLRWSPRGRIECSPPLRNSEYNFLPQWYIDGSA